MNSQVTDWELVLILLASVFTILVILTIVSRWLNFHLLSTCVNWSRNRKILRNTSSFADNTTQVGRFSSFLITTFCDMFSVFAFLSRNRRHLLSISTSSTNQSKPIMRSVCGHPDELLYRRWSQTTQHTMMCHQCVSWFRCYWWILVFSSV